MPSFSPLYSDLHPDWVVVGAGSASKQQAESGSGLNFAMDTNEKRQERPAYKRFRTISGIFDRTADEVKQGASE